MSAKKIAFVLCTVFIFCEGAFVDTLNKCSKDDVECHKNLFQKVLRDASKSGVPELEIPPFDPITLKDAAIPVLDIVDLKIVDGVVKGLKNCVINSFSTNVDKGKASMDMTCDLTIKGHYKAFSNSPIVQSLLGADSVRGDGNTKVKIEKLNMKFDINFFFVERDGDVYIKGKDEKLNYKYEIQGRLLFAADNLYLGDRDASEMITNMVNQNWKLIVNSVGNQFMDRAITRIRDVLRKFFDHVPTKHFIIEDLSSYVK